MIRVFNKFEPIPTEFIEVDTTSRGSFKDLSPFFLGPVNIPTERTCCKRMENLWQYSKVYPQYNDSNNYPSSAYFEWRKEGFNKDRATRYPMGKGVKPLYSYWLGEKLDYIEARKKIYIPHYTYLVLRTKSYVKLYNWVCSGYNIGLRDFDGYDHVKRGMSLQNVVNTKRPMGHAFIIYGLLTGEIKTGGNYEG